MTYRLNGNIYIFVALVLAFLATFYFEGPAWLYGAGLAAAVVAEVIWRVWGSGNNS